MDTPQRCAILSAKKAVVQQAPLEEHHVVIKDIRRLTKDAGVGTALADLLDYQCRVAVDKGYGDKALAALFETGG